MTAVNDPALLAQAKQAKEILVQLCAYDLAPPMVTLEDWRNLGTELWEHSYKEHKTDVKAADAMVAWVESELLQQPIFPLLEQFHDHPRSTERLVKLMRANPYATRLLSHKLHLAMPDEQVRFMWLARWVDQGCPRVIVEPKYAALLMATDVGKASVEHVIPPWNAFLIDLPTDLLTVDGEDGEQDPIQRICVQSYIKADGTKACHMIGVGGYTTLWRHNVPLSELAADTEPNEAVEFGLPCEARDERVVALMGRLVISSCVALMDSGNFHKQKSKGAHVRRRHAKGLTEIQTFVLGRPIKINCRRAILDYLNGNSGKKRGPVTVQSIVRGHWKQQVHGPQRSLRKFKHIEPYWRGPEDAKVLTRVVEIEHPKGPA